MRNFIQLLVIFFAGMTSYAQRQEPYVIEKHQIYPEQLSVQRVEKIRHTHHFYQDGKRVDSKSYWESMKIKLETGEVEVRVYVPYEGRKQATYYFYENDNCTTPTSEDVYEVSEDENVEDIYLVTRVYTLDKKCNVTGYRDEDDNIYQIRKREVHFNEDGQLTDIFDWSNSNTQWGVRWNYKYQDNNSRIIEQYNNYVQRLLHQIEYLNDKGKVIKRCNINAEGKEVNCATFKLEYDKDYLLKESIYDAENKLLRQTVYTRDAYKRTQKITISTPNSEGKMVVTEEHTFEYFIVK